MSEVTSARVVAHRRTEPADSLDYFPTPPWATRALFAHVLGTKRRKGQTVEEPACGEGHMAYVLADYFDVVRASDIHDYGFGETRDFLEPDQWSGIERPSWIVTNPPFGRQTLSFMVRALDRATHGVAMFVRTTQVEGKSRFALFSRRPPTIVAQFAERVPLHKGRWEPDGGTLTAYCWMVWKFDRPRAGTQLRWIPPSRERLHLARDLQRWACS